jgi:hypothetical protein
MESSAGIAGLYGPFMRGYAGGAEGTMLTQIAHFFLGLFTFNTDYHIPFPVDLHQKWYCTAPVLWLVSVYYWALAQNTHVLNESVAMAAAKPAIRMLF